MQTKPAKKEIKLVPTDEELRKQMTVKLYPTSENDDKTNGFLDKQFQKAEESRPDRDWATRQLQFEAQTLWNDDNTAETNLPIEFATIRNKMADEESQKPIFTFVPVEKDDVNKVDVTKELWDFVWTEADTDKEVTTHKLSKNIFGTGIWFEGMHKEIKTEFLPKVDDEGVVTGEAKLTTLSWLKGFALDIRDVYIDPVHDLEVATYCFIYQRNVSKETLENLKNDKNYISEKIDEAIQKGSVQQNDKKVFVTKEETETNDEQPEKWTLEHYYNKEKGIYIVRTTDKIIIREGVIPFAHGELPISIEVDHQNPFSMYGRGECELLESTKYERNVQRNMMIDRSRRSNDVKVALGAGLSLEEQGFIDDVTQVMSFDGDMSQFQYLKPPPADNTLQAIDDILRSDATWITGIDINSLTGVQTKTAFEARLQEQTKLKGIAVSLRQSDYFFVRMARQRLANIQLWLPITTGRKILGTSKFRTIPLVDKQKEQIMGLDKDNKAEEVGVKFIDKEGVTEFLQLTPKMIRSNMDVQVTTPSTTSILKDLNSLELQDLSRLILEIAPFKPDVMETFDFDMLIEERIQAIGKNPSDFIGKAGDQKAIQDTRKEVLEDVPLPPKVPGQPEREQLNPVLENPEAAPDQLTQQR